MIKRHFNTTPIDVRNFKTAESYVSINPVADYFSGYDWATIHVWWEDFDVFDGTITMTERTSSRVPEWASCNVPGQNQAIEDQTGTGKGTRIFRDIDLHAGEIYLHVNRNTATTGKVYFEVLARNQYGDQDKVQKTLDEMRDCFRDIVKAIKNLGAR